MESSFVALIVGLLGRSKYDTCLFTRSIREVGRCFEANTQFYSWCGLWCASTAYSVTLGRQPAHCLQFMYEKDDWIKKKTGDVFDMQPLEDSTGIYFKDVSTAGQASSQTRIPSRGPQTVTTGSLVTISYVSRAVAGGLTAKRVQSVTFIVDTPHPKVPSGLHLGVKGMVANGKRVLLVPGELMGSRAPVFVEIWVRQIREANRYTPAQLRRLELGYLGTFQAWLKRTPLYIWVSELRQGTSKQLPQHLRPKAPIPATTAEDFFNDDFSENSLPEDDIQRNNAVVSVADS